MNGFGANPPTVFDNISIVRAGGHFWGGQVFPAIWVFSASKVFQGIRVSNVDIVDPTYSGIMFQTNYVGGQPQNPVKDTVFTNVSITGAQKSGDAYDAKSGFGIWANPLPEPGQGPAVGSATFTNLQLSNNYQRHREHRPPPSPSTATDHRSSGARADGAGPSALPARPQPVRGRPRPAWRTKMRRRTTERPWLSSW